MTTSCSISSENIIGSVVSSSNNNNNRKPFWECSADESSSFLETALECDNKTVQTLLLHNLLTSVQALQVVERSESIVEGQRVIQCLQDPFHVWFTVSGMRTEQEGNLVELDEEDEDIPETVGGRLAVMTVAGYLNGITAKYIVEHPAQVNHPKSLLKSTIERGIADTLQREFGMNTLQLHSIALVLHEAVHKKVQADILATTPLRIQKLLAPEITDAEFQNVRKRVYETVILGKGLHNDDDEAAYYDTLATASNVVQHDIEKFKKCNICNNVDQNEFILDRKNGDVICGNCGSVVAESLMHEGSAYRKFEGEEDRNHHGDAANPLLSNAFNMGTSLSGTGNFSSGGIGGWGNKSRNLETILKNAHAYTELNLSNLGNSTDRRTRVGYKDRQKKGAFANFTHAGDALNLHEAVVQRAKEIFASFRDDRELLQDFKGVLAACLVEAFLELSKQGEQLLKQHSQTSIAQVDNSVSTEAINARASRRNELHHATLAGKGGCLLNETVVDKTTATSSDSEKPAASWNIEDCRSWLLDASRRIAQQWVAERAKNPSKSKNLPQGTLEEIEGQLVEYSISLCEQLEAEVMGNGNSISYAGAERQRVTTPRITDMSKLEIQWQHESNKNKTAVAAALAPRQQKPRRTAGQTLILKSAKRLGEILNNPLAGEAFHKELRNVIGKQEERKRLCVREEASRQRKMQMHRKKWLQARALQPE